MSFNLLDFLARALGGLNISGIEARVQAWLETQGQEYPDLKERTAALAAWLKEVVAESDFDPGTMRDTLYGVASDIIRGMSGVDHGAWQGGG